MKRLRQTQRRRHSVQRSFFLQSELLEERRLLAGDLKAHWSADDLSSDLKDGATVASWVDRVSGIEATGSGNPRWVENALGSRAAVRFDPADGNDYLTVADAVSPLSGAGDFTVTVAFATRSTSLVGQTGDWYTNTGLVDANRLAFGADWGLSINSQGQVAGGLGLGNGTTHTVYSNEKGLNDGQVHVVSWSRSGSTLSIAVDGKAAAVRTNVTTQVRDAVVMTLGALTGGNRTFPGDIADVRVYNGALDASELQALTTSIVAPRAGDDAFFLKANTPLVVTAASLLANDETMAQEAPAIQLVSTPTKGQLESQADGSYRYVPSPGFVSGSDEFTYRVTDRFGTSNVASVKLIFNSLADQQAVVLNELHVNPDVDTERVEFIELHNTGANPVDVSGWVLSDAVDFVLPANQRIEAGGYLVVSQDPAAVETKYGVKSLGPWSGRLSSEGEVVLLRNAQGVVIDRIEYQVGFPWPTVGDEPGYSMELINGSLDNDLGGNWRSSVGTQELFDSGELWQYFKGTQEASTPRDAWRAVSFDDASWTTGLAPIGFSRTVTIGSNLADMRNGYTSVFLRKTFEVEDAAAVKGLLLQTLYDDGIIVWINGTRVASANVPGDDLAYNAVASNSLNLRTFQDIPLPDPKNYLVAGENVISVQLFNQEIANADAYFDARLISTSGSPPGPTPGAINSIYDTVAPPAVRQVTHVPEQPKANEPVLVTARVIDPQGIGQVQLQYQLVEPGSYIRLTDAAYGLQWTTLPMRDDGTSGDARANDGLYSAVIPASAQVHRQLVRYRIEASDATGEEVTVPYADDPQPNFAYFVYNGVPGWSAANRPNSSPVVNFGAETMNQLPVYHLIADKTDVNNSQYVSSFEEVLFRGTLVYDGIVYDHIEFGIRGEFSTYQSGKNKWKFHFQRGHEFQARDNYGRPFEATWRTMNFSNVATPWVTMNRGMGGIDEAIAFKLYDLAGLPSPETSFLQFRVIDDAAEAPANQYNGDLWGLYMTIEHPDGRFLDQHDLPDGTTYKVENAQGDIKHQGETQPNARAEFTQFMNGANRTTSPESWWRENVDLEGYYTFRAINRAVNNMDIRDGWNHYLYHNSETNQWVPIPWDLDMLYVPTTHWSGEIRLQNSLRLPALAIEYRNRVRELQDLLFTTDQIGQLVDEYARFVNPQTGGLTMVDVDQFMWNYNPRSANGHQGAFNRLSADYNLFQGPDGVRKLVSADHEGFAQWIKDFMLPAPGGGSTPAGYGANLLDQHENDVAIPATPVVTYIGPANFPLDQWRFSTSPFSDPQGDNSFASMQWRVAEVTDPTAPSYDPKAPPRYEVEELWTSEELTTFESQIAIPQQYLEPGHAYRVRVRMKDDTGRWSHWSAPVQLTATAGNPADVLAGLRVNELHYNPAAPSQAELAAAFVDADQFEFIELTNISNKSIDLRGVKLQQLEVGGGISFDFATAAIKQLEPGQHVVIVSDADAFAFRYGTDRPVAGEFDGQLSNGGETITIEASGVIVQQFAYDDAWLPTTDGQGYSMQVVDVRQPDLAKWNLAAQWTASSALGGTPGRGTAVVGDVTGDGVFNSVDLIAIFQAGKYEDDIPNNATYAEGDWNGDGDFTSSDLVAAFQAGTYVLSASPRGAKSTEQATDPMFDESLLEDALLAFLEEDDQ